MEIVQAAFTKKLLKSGRATRLLIISVTEPEQANCLIDAGLIWSYELHDCEPFEGDCIVTQCFKCYQYKHVGQKCHNLQRCGFCAGTGHATNDCLGRDDRTKHQCVSCKGNHPAWARECPVRAKHVEAAQAAYNTRPVRYQQASQKPMQHPRVLARPRPASTQENTRTSLPDEPRVTAATDNPLEDWQQPWIEVSHKRANSPHGASDLPAKRQRGRPLGSTRASKNTKDIRTFAATQ